MTLLSSVEPHEAQRLMAAGAALIDIREPDEFAREHIPGAINIPLARMGDLPSGPVIFHCRSGMRTKANAAALIAAANGECHMLAGGTEAWRAAALPTRVDRDQPLEIMRQVQLVAGGLVLLGAVLAILVSPGFIGLSAFVGAGLMFAGASGWCGMAKLLHVMPWNRRTTA